MKWKKILKAVLKVVLTFSFVWCSIQSLVVAIEGNDYLNKSPYEKGVICIECSYEGLDDYKYCPDCGEKTEEVGVVATKTSCPVCAESRDSDFCTECGEMTESSFEKYSEIKKDREKGLKYFATMNVPLIVALGVFGTIGCLISVFICYLPVKRLIQAVRRGYSDVKRKDTK